MENTAPESTRIAPGETPMQLDRFWIVQLLLAGQEGKNFLTASGLDAFNPEQSKAHESVDELMTFPETPPGLPVELNNDYGIIKEAEEFVTLVADSEESRTFVAFPAHDAFAMIEFTVAGGNVTGGARDALPTHFTRLVAAFDASGTDWSLARCSRNAVLASARRVAGELEFQSGIESVRIAAEQAPDMDSFIAALTAHA